MSSAIEDRKFLLTLKFRLKDKHASELKRQARSVSFVWNYCNEMLSGAMSGTISKTMTALLRNEMTLCSDHERSNDV
jgi:hypothetical protein